MPADSLVTAIDLNSPGRYLHWSIFTVSLANLILIVVMVVIFGVALLLPFPRAKEEPPEVEHDTEVLAESPGGRVGNDDPVTRRMWTARLRRRAVATLPPDKLLPDRQPAYVASWIHIFGVASLAALGVAIVSGSPSPLGVSTGGTRTRSVTSSTVSTSGAWSCSWPCW